MSISLELSKKNFNIDDDELKSSIFDFLEKLGTRTRVLILPPDFTRFYSRAGRIAEIAWQFYKKKIKAVIPALGSHEAMTIKEKQLMFGSIPDELFINHNFKKDINILGSLNQEEVYQISERILKSNFPVGINKHIIEDNFDLILSIGQIVPHEVAGMSGHLKNVIIGTGVKEALDISHWIGAVYGIENIIGKIDNPVRALLDRAGEVFLSNLPLFYLLPVLSKNEGKLQIMGIFGGEGRNCFKKAAELSQELNIQRLNKKYKKIIVKLDAGVYKSTWLGNKAIYRTKQAIAKGGELVIIGPGVEKFGEDKEIDALIRKYGYKGRSYIRNIVEENGELSNNLCAAAHLIHGSTDNNFSVKWCPAHLTEEEIKNVGYDFGSYNEYEKKYSKATYGINLEGTSEEFFYIDNPGMDLWIG